MFFSSFKSGNTRIMAIILGLSVCAGYVVYVFKRKKDDEDDEDDLDYIKFSSRNNFKVLETKIPNAMVGTLIGRNGKNIKAIVAETNTKINFKKNYDKDENRICTISGKMEDCFTAQMKIYEFLSTVDVIECEEMWIPHQYVGKIIGFSNQKMIDIIAKSGTQINISYNDKSESSCRIIIKGPSSGIKLAQSLINEVMQECQSNQLELDITLSKRQPRLPPKTHSPNLAEIAAERLSPTSSQLETSFEVYVSAMVDPSHFFVQIVGPKAIELDQLVEEMTEYYRNPNNTESHVLKKIEPGNLVAAMFQYDNNWYRAEVLNVHAENGKEPHAELFFLDYGDSDVVPVKSTYELRTDFLKLHFQAIECYLARVGPIGEMWTEEAIDYFAECTHLAQWKKLSARINGYSNRQKTRAKRETSPVPGLDLYDVVNNKDIDIAKDMVERGYAVFKEENKFISSRDTNNKS